MARREEYESKVEAWLLPLLEKNQFELVDVEYVREAGIWYLRAYIDKEGGITVDDCEAVSSTHLPETGTDRAICSVPHRFRNLWHYAGTYLE